MLLPLCRPLKIACVVIAGFFELRLCATMFAETNWPRDSFGFACLAASYAVWSASGVVPSFAAIPLKESLFDFGAVVDGVVGFFAEFVACDMGCVRVIGAWRLACAWSPTAAPRVSPIMRVEIRFIQSSDEVSR